MGSPHAFAANTNGVRRDSRDSRPTFHVAQGVCELLLRIMTPTLRSRANNRTRLIAHRLSKPPHESSTRRRVKTSSTDDDADLVLCGFPDGGL